MFTIFIALLENQCKARKGRERERKREREHEKETKNDISHTMYVHVKETDFMQNYGKNTRVCARHHLVTIGGNYTKHSSILSIFDFSELIENICSICYR